MASRIKAIHTYWPRIHLGKLVENDEITELIASRTGLNESTIRSVLFELHDVVIFYNKQARPVKLEGLDTYTPAIQLDGTITVGHRTNNRVLRQLNLPGAFRGSIKNEQYIGKSSEELVALWNAAHPEDPVQ